MKLYCIRRRGGPLLLSSTYNEDLLIISSSPLSSFERDSILHAAEDEGRIRTLKARRRAHLVPHLFVSAGVFLVSLLFFHPFLGVMTALLFWVFLRKADERNIPEIKSVSTEISEDIDIIEKYYESLYSYSLRELADAVSQRKLPLLGDINEELRKDIAASLYIHLKDKDNDIDRILRRADSSFLIRQVTTGSLDLLDLSLYLALEN